MKPEYTVVMRREVVLETTVVVNASDELEAGAFARSRAARNLVEWEDVVVPENKDVKVKSISEPGGWKYNWWRD